MSVQNHPASPFSPRLPVSSRHTKYDLKEESIESIFKRIKKQLVWMSPTQKQTIHTALKDLITATKDHPIRPVFVRLSNEDVIANLGKSQSLATPPKSPRSPNQDILTDLEKFKSDTAEVLKSVENSGVFRKIANIFANIFTKNCVTRKDVMKTLNDPMERMKINLLKRILDIIETKQDVVELPTRYS